MNSFVYKHIIHITPRILSFNITVDYVQHAKDFSTLTILFVYLALSVRVTMSTVQSPKASQGRPRARKSIAHFPLQDPSVEKENTEELLSNAGANVKPAKKTRSKSFGPGGLDALKEDTGNAQKVNHTFMRQDRLSRLNL